MRLSLLVARFPYGGTEHHHTTTWLTGLIHKVKNERRIGSVQHMEVDDTPITMSRNRVLKMAFRENIDLVLMVDSDMSPDLALPGARPFWESSFAFMVQHAGPCVVGAPYCGPPPHENVYIFRWSKKQEDNPNADLSLEQYSREEAAVRAGFEEVAALPTGLMLIDMRGVKKLSPPWFDYEYADPPLNTEKATTEDVYFTRNLSLAGVPQYVNWDAWAGHVKRKIVGKPTLLTCESVREQFREAVTRNQRSDERLIDVGLYNPTSIICSHPVDSLHGGANGFVHSV